VIGPGFARDRGDEDDSLRKALSSRDPDAIQAETVKRLEAGRVRFIEESVAARATELAALQREQARLAEKGDTRRAAVIRDYAGLVAAELSAARRTLRDIERVRKAGKGEAILAGRVLDAAGAPVAEADVVFVDAQGEVLSVIPPVRADADGAVWVALNAEQLKAVTERGGRLSAQARVGGRIVASDAFSAPLTSRGAYTFDLRAADGSRAGGGQPVRPADAGGASLNEGGATRPTRSGPTRPGRGGST
jgi:hypothetical protein